MILWTKWHAMTLLPAFAVMVIIALVLAHFLKDKDEKYKMIPIKIIALIIVIIEIIKQVKSIVEGYDLYYIPLHFCSLFIFFLPLYAFYKGKFTQQVRGFTTICCSMLFVFMMIYPELIYSGSAIQSYFSDFISFHTVTFHNLALFAYILIIALKLYTPDTKRDTKTLFIGFSIYSVIAGTMAQLLKTNFNNFSKCNIAPLRSIQDMIVDKIGWFGQLLYVIAVAILIFAFALACYWLYRGILALINLCGKKIAENKKEQKQN